MDEEAEGISSMYSYSNKYRHAHGAVLAKVLKLAIFIIIKTNNSV